MITQSEETLVQLVSEAASKTRRGEDRLAKIAEEVASRKAAIATEADALGKAQAASALEGSKPPDSKSARSLIESHRTRVVELQVEAAEIQQQLDDIERAIKPHRERLQVARRRRALEASSGYLDGVMDDVVDQLPKIAAALAVQTGETIDFYASLDRIAIAIHRRIGDRHAFRQRCLEAHQHLLDTLKVR